MLRAAVIGVGQMGQNHVRVYSELDGVRIVAVADINRQVAEAVARRYQVEAIYTTYQRMLDEVKLDIVSVAVPIALHRDVALEAIKRGIHVLVEKPIASTVEEGQDIVRRAREMEVQLGVGHIERFNPAIVELKRRLDAGALGQMFQLHARRLTPSPGRIQDAGVVMDLATHDLDMMRFLTGSEVDRIYAEIAQGVHDGQEDLLSVLLRFKDGTVGALDANWLTPTKIRELAITGEKGMFLVNYLTQDLYFFENDATEIEWEHLARVVGVSEGDMTKLRINRREPLRVELESFVSAVAGNEHYEVCGEDGLETLKLAEGVLKSGQSRSVVTL